MGDRRLTWALVLGAVAAVIQPLQAQTPASVEVQPATLVLERGTQATFQARVLDGQGRVLDAPVRMVAPRDGLSLDGTTVTGAQLQDVFTQHYLRKSLEVDVPDYEVDATISDKPC